MKSSKESLNKRGYFDEDDLNYYLNEKSFDSLNLENFKEIIANSDLAIERSIAIHLLAKNYNICDLKISSILIDQLAIEKALYTKLEIQNALVSGDTKVANLLIDYLGIIGNNQYKTLDNAVVSKKKSYPLPRDIIARILSKMDSSVFSVLIDSILNLSSSQLSELIDAIGFMVFYNKELATDKNLDKIIILLDSFSDNEIIIWKITTCLSSFSLKKSKNSLIYIKNNFNNEIIQNEVKRSLNLIF